MLTLLRLIAARHLGLSKGRTALTLLGICIGVSAVVGITALNQSVLDAFNNMVDSISRGSDLQVSGGEAAVPDDVLETVRGVSGVASASPLLENMVLDPETGDRILVLGIDFLGNDPFRGLAEKEGGRDIVDDEMAFLNSANAILLAGPYAQSRQLKKGSKVRLVTPSGPVEFEVFGLLAPTGAAKAFGGSVGIMHMDAAQLTFGKAGRYDRIDVEIAKGQALEVVRQNIRAATQNGLLVDQPKDRGVRISHMIFALQTGLQLTSGVALLVGIFVVFNTMAMAVIQRRRELATLRALGSSRREVTLLIAGEAAILGLVGGVLGVFLGMLLAQAALETVADAISALYVEIKPGRAVVSPLVALVGFAMGLVTSIVGAATPAWQAAGISPVMVLAGRAASVAPPRHWLMAVVGVVVYAVAYPLSQLPPVMGVPVFGYVCAFLILLGTALCGPLALLAVRGAAEPVMRVVGSIMGLLAAGNLVRDLGRASVTSVALMFGLSLSIGVGAMVGSFKFTIDSWLLANVPADIFLSTGGALADQKNIPIKPELVEGLKNSVPGIADVFHVRIAQLPYEDLSIQVLSLETSVYFQRARLIVRDGPAVVTGEMFHSSKGVTISENLAYRKKLKAGDTLVLGTPKGPRAFPILAVAVDFTSEQGFALMDRATYVEAFGDPLLDMVQVYLAKGAVVEDVRKGLAQVYGKRFGLNVITNQQFRGYVGGLVDNAFRITNAVQLVAVLIALLGIVNTLMASVLDRTREIGVLRAVGSLRRQISVLMVYEACMLGIAAALLAVVGGTGFGYIFTGVISYQSTGWSLPFVFPTQTVLESFGLSVAVAALAALIPAHRAGRLEIRDALNVD